MPPPQKRKQQRLPALGTLRIHRLLHAVPQRGIQRPEEGRR
jgi:hypothetical protein